MIEVLLALAVFWALFYVVVMAGSLWFLLKYAFKEDEK